jgi:predicted dehydrogenase
VGCGAWGRHVLRDLVALGCSVSVVARSDASRATAEGGGAAGVVDSIQALGDVEGVIVVTPTRAHASTVEQSLALGVPVFVEKPLTDDPREAKRLAAAAPERLFVMDKWRYHPGIELLAGLVRSGELGRVRGLRTTRIGWGNAHDVDGVWVLVPHDLAIGLEILGTVLPARAAVADSGEDGAHGLVGLLGDRPWHALEVASRSPLRRREITLTCEEGTAVLTDSYDEQVLIRRDGGEPETRPISAELPLLRELRAFVEHLGGGPPPRSSAAEGALVVERIAELRALAGVAP